MGITPKVRTAKPLPCMTGYNYLIMKAEILPLSGKYYGTEIKVSDGQHEHHFKLWSNASFEPSDRELGDICTIEQWRRDEEIDNGGEVWTAKDFIDVGDGHFESRETYKLAQIITEAINSSNVERMHK